MKYTFLEYCDILRGYSFAINNRAVYKFQLYWNKVDPFSVLSDGKYQVIKRVIR